MARNTKSKIRIKPLSGKFFKITAHEMIVERTNQEDWNARVIFDNLISPIWNDDKIIIDVIWDAYPEENIRLIVVTLPKDNDGFEYCDNYKMRKETDEKPVDKDRQDKTFVVKDTTQNKQNKWK